MSWQLLVAISVLTYAFSVLLQKVILREDTSDPVAFSIIFQFIVGIILFIAALIHGFVLPDLHHYIVNIILMMTLYGAGNIFIFNALKRIDASTFTILFTSRSLWTILGALMFLGEVYTLSRFIGAILIIASVVIVSWKGKSIALGKGELLSLCAGICFGFAFVNDAFIVQHSDVISYNALAFILPSLGVLAIQPMAAKKIIPLLHKDYLFKLLLLSVFYAISAFSLLYAYKVGRNAAQIAPLQQTTVIATVILSIIFLKEKSDLVKKSIGTIISFIGVILVG